LGDARAKGFIEPATADADELVAPVVTVIGQVAACAADASSGLWSMVDGLAAVPKAV